jgi:hypothetical protein
MTSMKTMAATALTALLSMAPFSVGTGNGIEVSGGCLNAAEATPTCPGSGCIGGNRQCAKLPNGVICYTEVIIIIEVPGEELAD